MKVFDDASLGMAHNTNNEKLPFCTPCLYGRILINFLGWALALNRYVYVNFFFLNFTTIFFLITILSGHRHPMHASNLMEKAKRER